MGDDFYCEQVLSGEMAVEVVAETEGVLAFRHTRPHWRIHVVVTPKKHIASFTAVTAAEAPVVSELLDVVRKVALEMEGDEGGAHIVTNVGKYQDSKHLHFHVGCD